MANFDLSGRSALVTGAGRGLGKAIADGLAEAGAVVYGTSRDHDTALSITRRYGTPAAAVEMTDTATIRDTVASLLDHSGGGIDLLVNNAGVNIPKLAVEITEREWDTVLDTNLRGSFFLTTELAKSWLASSSPAAVVNIASQAGLVAIEERAAYGASKAALVHLTKSLALEWAPTIRVNAVAPTFVRTELTESTLSRPDWANELRSRIPMGRFGEPGDIVGAVLFLLSDAAGLITGHTISIDGGYTIH
jgi:NAD(P)-dependent dehydrogenase (short-subunit alcohol dehydrogenase family)